MTHSNKDSGGIAEPYSAEEWKACLATLTTVNLRGLGDRYGKTLLSRLLATVAARDAEIEDLRRQVAELEADAVPCDNADCAHDYATHDPVTGRCCGGVQWGTNWVSCGCARFVAPTVRT